MIKIVEWVEKVEELEHDFSKGEVYSAVSFSIPFREDEIRSSFSTEPAFLIAEKKDPIALYLSDMLTASANLAGIPAISIPVGLRPTKAVRGNSGYGKLF